MKTKNLVIIFILFLLMTLASGLVVFLTGEKEQSVSIGQTEIINSSNQPATVEEKLDRPIESPAFSVEPRATEQPINIDEPIEVKPIILSEKIVPAKASIDQVGQIQVAMLINGIEYRIAIEPNGSVYDLMSALRGQKRLDFNGKNYSALGFFIEEINGVKNDPSGKNWLYYVNGQPAQVGISFYIINNNDVIEWKYENKSF